MRNYVQKDVSVPRLGINARMVQREDGGPMRDVQIANQKRVTGWYSSFKNGGHRFHESGNEKKAFFVQEMRTDVRRYNAQPHTLEFVMDGRKRSYTPDRLDEFANGRIEIVEVKGGYKAESKPDYQAKLDLAKSIYGNLGWSFRIQDVRQLERTTEYHVFKYMQTFRRTVVTPQDEAAVLTLLRAEGAVPLARARGIWSSSALGFAKLCALMTKRSIAIDISGGLSDESVVSIVAE